MTQENTLLNNTVSLIGEINSDPVFSHEVYGEGFYTFSLAVARLSNNQDILPITVSERLISKEKMEVGRSVFITGQIRTYNNFTEGDIKKNKLVLTVFVRQLEFLEEDISQNPNQVYLSGFICKEPVYRTTPFGREITDILLAVNRAYNKSDYIPCIAWGRSAKFASKLEVGDNIKITGRMQARVYQKKLPTEEFIEKIAYEVSVFKIDYESEENKYL